MRRKQISEVSLTLKQCQLLRWKTRQRWRGKCIWNCSCYCHMVAPRQLVNVKLGQTLDESWTDLRTFWSVQECRLGASLHFTEEITRVQMSKLLLKVHPEVYYWTRSILGEHLFFSFSPNPHPFVQMWVCLHKCLGMQVEARGQLWDSSLSPIFWNRISH